MGLTQWRYIESGLGGSQCGRAQLMRRRGWSVGEPVSLPNARTLWNLPCSRPVAA